MQDIFSLDGKVALVTGGTRGIGRALLEGLVQAGAQVVFTGSSKETVAQADAELRVACIPATGVVWDASGAGQAADLVDEVVRLHGTLDILVNCAGIIRRYDAESYPDDDWDEVLAVNLSAAFRLSREAGKVMLAQGSGKIVNIASVLAYSGGRSVVAYAVSKGGLVQLTKALATEWAHRGVNVNAIASGYIRTDLTRALQDNEERERELLARLPAGRWGVPDDLVGATVFLASQAADYVHGAVLAVDGGWTAA
ncbi:SDR family oxidoreductase [Streptacidiphilus sp. P02-A3a]|uniref:SDR family oxidoreductase n=1 Tax=Streptacidiphilus sp. P02-A3a TaxID=2704468 RepID=UPI0015FB4FB4|nr:SDR family oxidoreductase [Streptacidiphilus sp. P02-A3a]QMU69982.1 SDR family oxidoreductase [Streptacidiphilus sp. P02-A3a]